MGNYDYSEVNEAIVSNIDSIYVVEAGSRLNIKPKIVYTQDKVGDTTNYTYEWFQLDPKGGIAREPILRDSFTNFSCIMDMPLGEYNYTFRVTDKRTGVWKDNYFVVLVNNAVYEGNLILSDIGDNKSRLDMLSWNYKTNKFDVVQNALATMKSDLQLDGAPSFISYFYDPSSNNPYANSTFDAIIVATSKLATYLGADFLEYKPQYNLLRSFSTGKNEAIGTGGIFTCADISTNVFLSTQGNVFSQSYRGTLFNINRMMDTPDHLFKASPYVAVNNNVSILFNEDNSEFVYHPENSYTGCVTLQNGESLFKNKIDKSLLFMKYITFDGGEIVALLKDKSGSKVYLARFNEKEQKRFEEITNTFIADAEHFEIDNIYGYVFYNVGSKVYLYDTELRRNQLIADYGNKKISLLNYPTIAPHWKKNNTRYQKIARQLNIYTYNPADLKSSGGVDVFEIMPSGQVKKEASYSGFGKVVSTSYRNRI